MANHLMAIKASWVDNHLTELIQPTSLRAPEVILRANWGPSADIWSAACVVSSSDIRILAFDPKLTPIK